MDTFGGGQWTIKWKRDRVHSNPSPVRVGRGKGRGADKSKTKGHCGITKPYLPSLAIWLKMHVDEFLESQKMEKQKTEVAYTARL